MTSLADKLKPIEAELELDIRCMGGEDMAAGARKKLATCQEVMNGIAAMEDRLAVTEDRLNWIIGLIASRLGQPPSSPLPVAD